MTGQFFLMRRRLNVDEEAVKGSDQKKLLSLAAQDAFLARVICDLGGAPNIRFSWFCATGMYTPDYVRIHRSGSSGQISGLIQQNQKQPGIMLSRGFNFNMIAHSFFHELVHCYQDACGLFLFPLIRKGEFPIMPDLRGFIKSVLFCEAWAETEAIRISWRLRQNGAPQPWQGVMQMPQWRGLALSYQCDLERGEDDDQAAAQVFQKWYEGRHCGFYTLQAMKMYHALWRECACDKPEDIRCNLRAVTLPALIERLPEDKRPSFFGKLDLGANAYNSIHAMRARWAVARFEEAYGATQNHTLDDFSCGTLRYLKSRADHAQIDKIAV